MKIIQIYDKLDRHGGAQSILRTLDEYFTHQFEEVYISGLSNYDDFFYKSEISKKRYIKFSILNIFSFSNAIVISHSRKLTTLFVLMNNVLNLNSKIIHISHSIFDSKRFLTLYPKNIIAVSNAVKKNLIDYFNVPEKNVIVIYNGIKESNIYINKKVNSDIIKIIYVARIEDVKQQIEIVENLSSKIKPNIQIDFVGDGSKVDELKIAIKRQSNDNFRYIGYSNNIIQLIENYDYVMLFSKKEGLGLTLVEGAMLGKPLISRGNNGCEACAEVCIDGFNGFITNTFDELLQVCNNLDNISKIKYEQMAINSKEVYSRNFRLNTMLEKYKKYILEIKNV
jgi:glycosyltransferase involved in cell wall biosynthesis